MNTRENIQFCNFHALFAIFLQFLQFCNFKTSINNILKLLMFWEIMQSFYAIKMFLYKFIWKKYINGALSNIYMKIRRFCFVSMNG